MRVRIRHEDDLRGHDFCEIEPTQQAIDRLIVMIKHGGGIYYYNLGGDDSEYKQDISYSFVLDEDGAFLELRLND